LAQIYFQGTGASMALDLQWLETKNGGRDWPLIVQSIECPVCLAGEGQPCTTTRVGSNPMLNQQIPRPDWHVERKYAAAQVWYQQQTIREEKMQEETPATEPVLPDPGYEAPASDKPEEQPEKKTEDEDDLSATPSSRY
jgi:hypothetical protein